MRTIDARVVGGVLLIGFGLLFFLQTLGVTQALGSGFLWGVLFGAAGLLFLYAFLRDREQWWAIFPAMPMLGIAALMLLNAIAPALAGVIGGGLFLGLVSLGFWMVYYVRRDFWWAIIPGGAIATTAIIALLSNVVPAVETTALMLLGVGLTFLVLYFLPEGRGRQPWAIIPGGILIIIAALTGIAFGTMARFFWPLVFILGGLFLILRSRKSTPSA
ncbi:MAG: hypothetical protein HW375_1629 [Anaerolineales bacterium]|jgi:hypothetical protein|nr:hypothetical protein [Anaerolineales bacterium]